MKCEKHNPQNPRDTKCDQQTGNVSVSLVLSIYPCTMRLKATPFTVQHTNKLKVKLYKLKYAKNIALKTVEVFHTLHILERYGTVQYCQ